MVNAQRSRHLGPDGKAGPGGRQNTTTHLIGGICFQRMNDNRVVEWLIGLPRPTGRSGSLGRRRFAGGAPARSHALRSPSRVETTGPA